MFNYTFDWSMLLKPQYFELLVNGFWLTLLIAVVTFFASILFGTFIAFLRLSPNKYISRTATIYVEFCRNIPGLFWIMFFYFVFPEFLPKSMADTLNAYTYFPIIAGIIGLTVDNSGYVSDIVRGGVLSVPKSEKDAGIASGLDTWQLWRYVLLPHTIRTILPPLGGRMIHNLKNSSLCMAIGAPEITWATQQIESLTFRGMEATILATVVYICLAFLLTLLLSNIEKKLDIAKNAALIK